MDSISNCIQDYTILLSNGQIQRAYKEIIKFMSELSSYLHSKYPDCALGSMYLGYLDMTYFAFTPSHLKDKKLKIAIVYLHKESKFEAWLCGSNRRIQSEYIIFIGKKKLEKYKLSKALPGIDSIIESTLVENPDFDHQEELMKQIELKAMEFLDDIIMLLL